MNKKRISTFDIVLLALLVAINIVLERLLGFVGVSNAYSISFLAVAFAAAKFGILGGMLVSGLGDFIGAFFNGGPNVCITLVAILLGFFYGIALNEKTGKYSFIKTLLAVVPSQIFCSLFLNTFFICLFYAGIEKYWSMLLVSRLPQALVVTPIQIILIHICAKTVFPKIKLPQKQ